MPRTQEKRPRASNGRFVRRTRTASEKPAEPVGRSTVRSDASPDGDVSSDQPDVVRHAASSRREGSVRLALLTFAILCAALGFALSFFWIAALVLMGVLWGTMLAERPQRQGTVAGRQGCDGRIRSRCRDPAAGGRRSSDRRLNLRRRTPLVAVTRRFRCGTVAKCAGRPRRRWWTPGSAPSNGCRTTRDGCRP